LKVKLTTGKMKAGSTAQRSVHVLPDIDYYSSQKTERTFVQNLSGFLSDYTASHPRRQYSLFPYSGYILTNFLHGV
jgi:hypothetical protein